MKNQARKSISRTPRETMRIYYGTGKIKLYWTVRVHDAKKDVIVDGTLMDALRGTPGQTIGCHLSHCAVRNSDAFPHACIMASFLKRVCLVVDKVVGGQPVHAVRYVHSYHKLVDLNDTDFEKNLIKSDPALAEKSFLLRAPKGHRRLGAPHGYYGHKGKYDGSRSQVVPIGALARARKAGLVTADLANALNSS